MKRNILHGSLPLLLAAFLVVGCGEDPEIPQFESRNLSQGVLMNLPDAMDDLNYGVKFAIGSDIYYLGRDGNTLYCSSGASTSELMWRGLQTGSSITIKDNLLVLDEFSIESDRVAEYRQQLADQLAQQADLEAQIAALEAQIAALEAEERANYERIEALRDERDRLNWADENYAGNYDRLTAEIEELEAKNSSSYDQRNQLGSQHAELERQLENLLYSSDSTYLLEDTWRTVSEVIMYGYSNNSCSYNGKGYFYGKGSIYNMGTWTAAMLEYDPSQKRIKIYETVGQEGECLFSTAKGVFLSLNGSLLSQFSFSPEFDWSHIGGQSSLIPDDSSSYLGLLSQNDKLYSLSGNDDTWSYGYVEGGELVLDEWEAPYAQPTSTLSVTIPKDYGEYGYATDFSIVVPIFTVNGKLYLYNQVGNAFYEINPSTGRATVLFASWETHAIETPLFVAENSLYYLFQNQLYKLTF